MATTFEALAEDFTDRTKAIAVVHTGIRAAKIICDTLAESARNDRETVMLKGISAAIADMAHDEAILGAYVSGIEAIEQRDHDRLERAVDTLAGHK